MNSETRPLILLHTAVFLAGWTGIFGRALLEDSIKIGLSHGIKKKDSHH